MLGCGFCCLELEFVGEIDMRGREAFALFGGSGIEMGSYGWAGSRGVERETEEWHD